MFLVIVILYVVNRGFKSKTQKKKIFTHVKMLAVGFEERSLVDAQGRCSLLSICVILYSAVQKADNSGIIWGNLKFLCWSLDFLKQRNCI